MGFWELLVLAVGLSMDALYPMAGGLVNHNLEGRGIFRRYWQKRARIFE